MNLPALNEEIGESLNPTAQTAEQIAAARVVEILRTAPIRFASQLNEAMQTLWNPELNTQAVVDAMDARRDGLAKDAFTAYSLAATFLASQSTEVAAYLEPRPEGRTVTFNQDGSVTVT